MVDGYEGGGACCLELGICCWIAQSLSKFFIFLCGLLVSTRHNFSH